MKDARIRLLLVDDHASFRQSLALLLDGEPDLTVMAQAGRLAAAQAAGVGFDVAIVDLDLPDGNGLTLIEELHVTAPAVRSLILTGSVSRIDLARAVEAGAAGVLHKSVGVDEIVAAVRRLHADELLFSAAEAVALLRLANRARAEERAAHAVLARLSSREREVLQALAEGLGDKEIARRLRISDRTARVHMAHILTKLGVESRLQALVFAVQHGLVTIPGASGPRPSEAL